MPPRTKISKSGNPAKRAGVTSAKEWKKSTGAQELELPSGNVCRLKRPGLTALLADGIMPDVLTPIAEAAAKAGKSGKGRNDAAVKKVMDETFASQEGFLKVLDAADRTVAHVVIEPKVLYHMEETEPGSDLWETIPEEDRNPEILYTDEVDMDDKMFIFQFVVGGTRDLERFRQESEAVVGSLDSIEGAQDPS